MPRVLLAVYMVVSPLAGMTAPVPKMGEEPEFCYPTTVGTKTVTRVHHPDGSYRDSTHMVTAVEDKGGAKLVTVTARLRLFHLTSNGRLEPADEDCLLAKYLVSKDRLDMTAVYSPRRKDWDELKKPCCLFKFPARPGDEWTGENEVLKLKTTFTVGNRERVTVPAGTFDAIRIRSKSVLPGNDTPREGTGWYVPGIGNIKTMEGNTVLMELVSFTPGKAAK